MAYSALNSFSRDELVFVAAASRADGRAEFKRRDSRHGGTELAKDDAVVNKIIYKYSPAGKQISYSVFDANGKLIFGTASPAPNAAARPRNPLGH